MVFELTFKQQNLGAIGISETATRTVTADSEKQAWSTLIDQLAAENKKEYMGRVAIKWDV